MDNQPTEGSPQWKRLHFIFIVLASICAASVEALHEWKNPPAWAPMVDHGIKLTAGILVLLAYQLGFKDLPTAPQTDTPPDGK